MLKILDKKRFPIIKAIGWLLLYLLMSILS